MRKRSMARVTKGLATLLAVVMVLSSIPLQVQAAGAKSVTVSTQKNLNKALADENVTKITIKTEKVKTFTIEEGEYSDKTLIISAGKAKVHNYGEVKKVYVRDAKKYMEYASGNSIKVTDKKLTLGVEKGAVVDSLYLARNGAQDKVVVRGTVKKMTVTRETALDLTDHGVLKTLNLKTASDIKLSGKSTEAITVNTAVAAEGVTLASSIPVKINAKADIDVTLKEGAEGSVLKAKVQGAEIKLENQTKESVVVIDADGKETEVKSETADTEEKTDDAESSTGGSGGSGNVTVAVTGVTLNQTEAVLATNETLQLTATVAPANATNKKVTWTSDSEAVAVTENGLVTGVFPGKAVITVTTEDGSKTASCTITVMTPADKLEADINAGGTVTVNQNISGDVTATYEGTAALVIDFKNYTLTGDLSITAASATSITLKDAGADTAGARITSNLTVNAPNAHVENNVKVEGTVTIQAVANNTFVQNDSANKIEMAGAGKLEVADDLVVAPTIDITTPDEVILAGTVGEVSVNTPEAANVTISDAANVEKVTVAETAIGTKLSGNGSVQKVEANAPMTVAVPTTELDAKEDVTVNALVRNVVVTTTVTVTVGTGAAVTTVTTTVNVTIAGGGAVETVAVDTTKVDVDTKVQVTVEGATSVSTVVATEANKVEVESETEIPVIELSSIAVKETGKTSYFVGEALDVKGFVIKATYSNGDVKDDIIVTESMVSGFDSSAAVEVQMLTIAYGGKATTYDIEILADEVASIAITRNPDKMTYTRLDSFEAAGLAVEITWKSGKKAGAYYTDTPNDFGFKYLQGEDELEGLTKAGTVTVVVTYGGKTATVNVTVKPIQYTVTFDSNGGSEAPAAQVVDEDTMAKTPTAPTKEDGYALEGWKVQGKEEFFDFATPITGDITLVAVWKDIFTPLERLQSTLDKAIAETTITCDKEIAIAAEETLTIPAGVTLQFTDGGHVTITESGMIYISGTLITSEGDAEITFPGKDGHSFENETDRDYVIFLNPNGTWERGSETYQNITQVAEDNYGILYDKWTGGENGGELWFARDELSITMDADKVANIDWNIFSVAILQDGCVIVNGTTMRPTPIEKLYTYLWFAELNGGGTVTLDEKVTIEPDACIEIPAGVTLEFDGEGELIIELGGWINVYGTLITGEADAGIIFPTEYADDVISPLLLRAGGSWNRNGIVYQNISDDDSNQISYRNVGTIKWYVPSPLTISEEPVDFDPEIFSVWGDGSVTIGTERILPTAFQILENQLWAAEENGGGTVTITENVTIASGQSIQIPAGVTLDVSNTGNIAIEMNGQLYIEGTLKTGASDKGIEFPQESVDAYNTDDYWVSEPLSMGPGATWIRDNVTYATTSPYRFSSNYEKANGGHWCVHTDLSISNASADFDLSIFGIHRMTDGQGNESYGTVTVNGVRVLPTALQALQNQLWVAEENGGGTVTITENVTIASGQSIGIPAGVILDVSKAGELNIEENGRVFVAGIIKTGIADKGITFPSSLCYWPPLVINSGGTWSRDEVVYTTTSADNSNATYINANGGQWNVFSDLAITNAPDDFDVSIFKTYDNGSVTVNGNKVLPTGLQALQNQLWAAEEVGGSVTCSEEITIASGACIEIPAGVTLQFEGAGKLNIELGGWINVYGTLKIGNDDAGIRFPEAHTSSIEGGCMAAIQINSGGTWIRDDVTYQNASTSFAEAAYQKADGGTWSVWADLVITNAPEEFDLNIFDIYDEGSVTVDGVQVLPETQTVSE